MRLAETRGLALVALAGCTTPYPVLASGNGSVGVPPSARDEPLSAEGARVQVVDRAPPGCAFLGLGTGVGGVKSQYDPTRPLAESQRDALTALRNSVGRVGGTHTSVDAEVQYSGDGQEGVRYVVIRGPALRCR
jgi:hypothetical protein